MTEQFIAGVITGAIGLPVLLWAIGCLTGSITFDDD